ncbi:MAG: toxin-antitoxin system YwqK family antitoxin [Planctomycetota bacterium]|jgi:antitoxin component YwqK of YwqJK toxin-antitoxin module
MRKTLVLLAVTSMFINSIAYAEVRKSYYESGQLQLKVNFKDGERHGLTKEYYQSGDIKYIDTYKNGTKIHRKMYDERGKLEFEQDYPSE